MIRRLSPAAFSQWFGQFRLRWPAHGWLEQSGCDFFGDVGFDDVADLDVLEPLEADAAFKALLYFRDVVFEAAQGVDFALVDDHAVADYARGGSLQRAILHIAPGNLADARNSKHLANFGPASGHLTFSRFEQAKHRVFDLFLDLVNDRVEPNVDALDFGDLSRAQFRSDVEPDDYRGPVHVFG